MNIVLQDLCTSGHWDCGSGWLASTWKEKQRKAKIGKTSGTTNQVSCCKFQWLPSVWQMWGDSQLSIYGRSCWEIQTKGRRTCTSKVNISTFCKRLTFFLGYRKKVPCLSQLLECDCQNGQTQKSIDSLKMVIIKSIISIHMLIQYQDGRNL